MTSADKATGAAAGPDLYDPALHPELYDEILPRRVVAFAIDAFIVLVAMIPVALAVLVLGILTLGLCWLLYPFVFAVVGLGYLALTLGSEESATVGMRLAGIEMRTLGGLKMYPVLAILEGLLFWVLVGLLTPLILIIGLVSDRRRLLHDMLLGTVMLNSAPLHDLERGGKA